jgi:hypothetical protein
VKIPLRETAPALLAKMLQQAVQRSWQRQMGASQRRKGWKGSRVCLGPITLVLHSKWASTHKKEALAAAKCFCDAVWTPCRAREAGYVLDDLSCPLGGEGPDDLQHRILDCPAVEPIRAKHASTFKKIRKEWISDPKFFL